MNCFTYRVKPYIRGLFIQLSNTNERSNTNDREDTRENTVREREMKECVYAEACEGMLEDMPVTNLY